MSGWFVHPELAFLAGLAALPLVIHLLFRVRPPVVRWPAMDFLLAAMRKTRQRTRLEQMILLSLRMLLTALVAILVARPLLGDRLASLLAAGPGAEHVVVLDDTLSMGELFEGEPVFRSGVGTVHRLLDRLAERRGRNRVTIVRTSRPEVKPPVVFDAVQATVLKAELEAWAPTCFSRAPDAALEQAAEVLSASDAPARVLHVVGDFRERDWPGNGAAMSLLQKTAQNGVFVSLVDVGLERSERRPSNLMLKRLIVVNAPTAVGVPLQIDALISNRSAAVVENAPVEWRVDGKPAPRTIVKSIPANGDAPARFNLTLMEPGIHTVAAKLSGDALPADDERWLALQIVDQTPVLIVDGDERRQEGRFIATALAPGGGARTGWAPTLRTAEFLRAVDFRLYRVVFLVDPGEISTDAAKKLVDFASGGGIICSFIGPASLPTTWFELATKNLLPARPKGVEALSPSQTSERDVHPAGSFLANMSKGSASFLDSVRIDRRGVVEDGSFHDAETLLNLRDGRPLVLAKSVGAGKSALVLTTAGPIWNNWAANPSYVVFLLELLSHLASDRTAENSLAIGDEWSIPVDLAQHRRTAEWSRLAPSAGVAQSLELQTGSQGAQFVAPRTSTPGVFRISLLSVSGSQDVRSRAFNVDPAEGELKRADPSAFDQALSGTAYRMVRADDDSATTPASGPDLRDWLIALLVATLLAEQVWARRCSRRAA